MKIRREFLLYGEKNDLPSKLLKNSFRHSTTKNMTNQNKNYQGDWQHGIQPQEWQCLDNQIIVKHLMPHVCWAYTNYSGHVLVLFVVIRAADFDLKIGQIVFNNGNPYILITNIGGHRWCMCRLCSSQSDSILVVVSLDEHGDSHGALLCHYPPINFVLLFDILFQIKDNTKITTPAHIPINQITLHTNISNNLPAKNNLPAVAC